MSATTRQIKIAIQLAREDIDSRPIYKRGRLGLIARALEYGRCFRVTARQIRRFA